MAEWREKGFVPDSDEEDESQGSPHREPQAGIQEVDGRHDEAVEATPGSSNDAKHRTHKGSKDISTTEEEHDISRDYPLKTTDDDLDSGIDGQGRSHRGAFAERQVQAKPAEDSNLEYATQQARATRSQIFDSVDLDTSGASSPLSEAPSSLPDLQSLLRLPVEQHGGTSLDGPQSPSGLQDLHSEDEIGATELQSEGEGSSHPRRTFRRRNAIQLHPYVIEKEKYNQAWRARGLKPLHILQEEAARAQAHNEESQNFETSEAENSASSSPRADTTATSVSHNLRREEMSDADEGDLPDVSDLFQGAEPNFVSVSHKRQRVGPKFKRPPKLPTRKQDSVSVNTTNVPPDNESPLSPPLSGSQTPARPSHSRVPGFRVPSGAEFAKLPTPLTSSEPRKRRPRLTMLDDDSDAQSLTPQRPDSTSDVAESSAEDEVSHHLECAQRRIKGVLPASWLKLNLQKQAKQPQQEPRHPVDNSGNQKGVARPVRKGSKDPASRPVSRHEVFVLSDDDSSASDTGLQANSALPSPAYHPLGRCGGASTSLGEEAMEHDTVEALLPLAKRSRGYAQRSGKRQTKIVDFGARRENQRREDEATPSTLHYPAPRTKHHIPAAERKPKSRPPDLSILDAPGRQNASTNSHPAFIRVARRTARLRQNKGRHSPSSKFLRLANRKDTIEMNETIRAWREGSIAPSFVNTPQTARKPLHPRCANNATSLTSSELLPTPKQGKLVFSTSRSGYSKPRSSRTRGPHPSLANLVSRGASQRRGGSCLDYPPRHLPGLVEFERRNGQLLSSLKRSDDWRPALLESSQTELDNLRPQSAFHERNSDPNGYPQDRQIGRPILDRFLRDEDPLATKQTTQTVKIRGPDLEAKKPGQSKPIRARKRRPRRVDAATLQTRELISPNVVGELPDDDASGIIQDGNKYNQLQGLGPFGTCYTITFDVAPLPQGIQFSSDTFLGSGDFRKSLTLQANGNLDNFRGNSVITCDTKVFRWGSWNEVVSFEIGEIFQRIEQATQDMTRQGLELDLSTAQRAVTLQTAVISYFTSHVSFFDSVDRLSFLRRCKGLLSAFWNACGLSTAASLGASTSDNATSVQYGSKIAMLALVLANQLLQISEHSIVPLDLKDEVKALVETSAKQTYSVIGPGLREFERYLIRSRRRREDGQPLRIDQSVIEAFVVTHHILRGANIGHLHPLEVMQNHVSNMSATCVIDVGSSERAWQQLFALLPFLELDQQGALDVGRRFKIPLGHWTLVKRLITPILETYICDPRGQGPGFNAYCRCLFSRCLHLINGWGWYICDSIIGTIFDFFARNGLGHLRNEASHGSPLFLENLSKHPPLDAEPEDRCFHLLLKIIGSGVQHMQRLYNDKKIRDLVWRLMPNHGRSHPKEQAVRQEDLDALRNHHDLLCTLYWASPAGVRPSLNSIRNLVDLESSHREACHINIRAWFNLIKFQLSTEEPVEKLEHFAEWHAELLKQMLRQHSLARTEAEDQVRSALFVDGLTVSEDRLESIIAKNQRQVEAVLDDALVCLELAVESARTPRAAGVLLSPALTEAFGLLRGSTGLAGGVVVKALNVLQAYAKKCPSKNQGINSVCFNDDSQDYGDWSAFNDDNTLEGEPVAQASSPLLQIIGPLKVLVSNSFGADTAPPESFLMKLIDTWVAVGCILVEDEEKTWEDYLGQYGADAWHTLRNTDQTRKYAAYFFSALIERDSQVYLGNRLSLVKCWLGSLVERESMLKFQHKFTSSILNADPNDPLLVNVPFWKNSSSLRFSITAVEISDRRLSLISSILSNMRVSLEHACLESDTNAALLKQEYKDLLKHLMTRMKENYSELGQGSNIRGAYVDFVHRVVEFLQEHTASICPVDRFFTDSATFPLPILDPTYVVGKLKNYGTRLSDLKMQKETVIFLQSVSERAAVDVQQDYLVGQLHTAMSSAYNDNTATESTLCQLLMKAIVPAYLQMAFETSVGWVLAVPFLKASQLVFEGIHINLNSCDTASLDRCTSTLVGFLNGVRTAVNLSTDNADRLGNASMLKTLAACYQAINALLPTLDYMLRLGPYEAQNPALDLVAHFKNFATYLQENVAPITTTEPLTVDKTCLPDTVSDPQYTEVHSFTINELRDTLKKKWISKEDKYFVVRGALTLQVEVQIGTFEEERDTLILAIHQFGECLSAMSGLGGWDEWHEATGRVQNNIGCDGYLFL